MVNNSTDICNHLSYILCVFCFCSFRWPVYYLSIFDLCLQSIHLISSIFSHYVVEVLIVCILHNYYVDRLYIDELLNSGRRGCDRMVVGFKTTYAISAYHH
jgi:hypothetical protein